MEHYRSANAYMREQFGCKVYKLALDGGFTCPNRDGTCGTRGCVFCAGGSGDFAVPVGENFSAALDMARSVVGKKAEGAALMAYFQSFTGTYAPIERLRTLYTAAVRHPDIAAIDIATRPDCLSDEIIALLAELNQTKPVWVELGLQTIHPKTAEYIRRGYPLSVYDDAISRLKAAGLYTIVHMIIGLPGETPEMLYETASYIGRSGADGIKLQLLHVLRGTTLAEDYLAGAFETLSIEDYITLLEGCIRRLPPEMTVHRITGDGSKRDLLAPLWSADKRRTLNTIRAAFDRDGLQQGSQWRP